MKIRLRTQEYSDDDRRALWWHSESAGYKGDPAICPMASRDDCRNHLENVGRSTDADLNSDWSYAIDSWHEANNKL